MKAGKRAYTRLLLNLKKKPRREPGLKDKSLANRKLPEWPRTRKLTTRTPRQQECLEAVRRDVTASEALRFLVQKTGRTEESWLNAFIITAWWGAEKEKWDGESEPEELLKHAARISDTAETIHKLNSERFWDMTCPDVAIFEEHDLRPERNAELLRVWRVDPRTFKKTKKAFENLPHILEMYAKNLRRKSDFGLSFRKRRRTQGNVQHRMEESLLEFVRELTGRKYRDKIAAIFRVIYPIAGRRAIEGESLRKRDQRNRRLGHSPAL